MANFTPDLGRYTSGGGQSIGARYWPGVDHATLVLIGDEEVGVPAGCDRIEIFPRLCGDFYSEIAGPGFCASGVGETAARALQSAIGKSPLQ